MIKVRYCTVLNWFERAVCDLSTRSDSNGEWKVKVAMHKIIIDLALENRPLAFEEQRWMMRECVCMLRKGKRSPSAVRFVLQKKFGRAYTQHNMWNKVVKMRSKRRTLINRLLPLEKGREGTGQFFKCVFSSSSLAPTTFLFQMWHWTLPLFFLSFLSLHCSNLMDSFVFF